MPLDIVKVESPGVFYISSIRISKSALLTFCSLMMYRILLDIALYYVIGPQYSYQHMDVDLNNIKLVESYISLIIIYIFLPKNSNTISNLIIQLLFLSNYIPLLSYYAVSNESREWFLMATFFWLILLLFSRIRLNIAIVPTKLANQSAQLLCIIAGMGTYLLLLRYFGKNLSLSFEEVYETRKLFVLKGLPTFISGYFLIWMGKVVLPFLVLISLFRKQKSVLLFLFSMICGVYLFGVTGHKVFIIGLAGSVGLAFLLKKQNFMLHLNLIFSILLISGMLLVWFFDNYWVIYLVARRTFLIPAQLSFVFHEFFAGNPLYLSHSVLSRIIDYPYDLAPAHVIADYFFGTPARSANNGIIADGYMNFGFTGIIIWALALTVMVKLADTIGRLRNFQIAAPIMMISFYNLTNLALLSTILTHGLFLTYILVFCLPKGTEERKF